MDSDAIIVGAGVAGLSLAGQLALEGRRALLLEKSRGVGGRCATRRVNGSPVDHGVPLLHGRTRRFLERVEELAGARRMIRGWPHQVEGEGVPCQPQAYLSGARRFAVEEGVSALPKLLAADLELELETRVEGVSRAEGGFEVSTSDGKRSARCLVITCPATQTIELLAPLAAEHRAVESIRRAMRDVFMLPCLTTIAGYDRDPAELGWQLRLPGPESAIHTIVNDSSKRPQRRETVLVIQARPAFSRENLEAEASRWSAALLAEAAALAGDWIGAPSWQQDHRWRYARVQRGQELSRPVLLRWDDGAELGICGDAFHPAGGVEGAFLSGLELADRIISGGATPASSAT